MQEITYITPTGEDITISPRGPHFIFDSVNGVSAIDTQMVVSTPASLDGTIFQTINLNDREVTLDFHVFGKTREKMYENRQKIIRLLSSSQNKNGNLGELHYQNDHGHWWIPATVKQGPKERSRRTGRYLHLQAVFYCPDPLWRSAESTIDRLAYLSGGFEFPLEIPAITEAEPGIQFGTRGCQATIFNAGDALAPFEITLIGPAELPTLTLKSTGEWIRVYRALDVGDKLDIDTTKGRKKVVVTRADGRTENAMGYIDPNSVFFQLQSGTNVLEYSSGNDTAETTAIVRTWSRFGGV